MTRSLNFKNLCSLVSVFQAFLLLELRNKNWSLSKIKFHILLKNRHSNQHTTTCLQNIMIVAVETYKTLFCKSSTTFLKAFLPVGTLLGFIFVAFILLKRSSIELTLYFEELDIEKYLHHKEPWRRLEYQDWSWSYEFPLQHESKLHLIRKEYFL